MSATNVNQVKEAKDANGQLLVLTDQVHVEGQDANGKEFKAIGIIKDISGKTHKVLDVVFEEEIYEKYEIRGSGDLYDPPGVIGYRYPAQSATLVLQ